jgi:hypothetical protein
LKSISISKVQKAFNDAIKRRDCKCVIKDFEPCYGGLEASHFFTVGGNPSLRFFPPNAYAQCQKHHFNHHNKSVKTYIAFMQTYHNDDLIYMQKARNCYIKYDEAFKAEIIKLCNADKLNELTELIKERLGY